jgi:hypothetical protein
MQVENFRIWHWVSIGVLVGLLFSALLAVRGPWFDTESLQTLEQGEFDWNALYDLHPGHKPGNQSHSAVIDEQAFIDTYRPDAPLLKDVIVHPPPTTDLTKRWWVTGKYFLATAVKDPKSGGQSVQGEWFPFKYPASEPYLPAWHNKTTVDTRRLVNELLAKKQAAAAAADPTQKFSDDDRRKLNTMKDDLDWDVSVQKRVMDGGKNHEAPDSFANVGEFLKFVSTKEPARGFTYHVAWWELKWAIWVMPAVAGILVIGFGGPLLVNVLQVMGLARYPERVREVKKPQPKAVPARVIPAAATAGVTVVAPPPQRPMTEEEKKEYGGVYYPVVKSTHKDKH